MYVNRTAFLLLMVGTLLLSPLAMAVGPEEPGTVSTSPDQLARELIRLSGGGDLGKQVMVQVIDSFRPLHPEIPEEFWTEFVASVDPREIEELVIPVYVEHLTAEEMSAAIEFYRTPEGRSLIEKLPLIVRESFVLGQRWGAELGREVAERVSEYKKSLPEA